MMTSKAFKMLEKLQNTVEKKLQTLQQRLQRQLPAQLKFRKRPQP